MRVILVPGTWGGKWCEDGSAFTGWMKGVDLAYFVFNGWSCDVDGVNYNPFSKRRKHADWISGGFALSYKLENIPPEERIVLAHSHGGQVAFYCAAVAGCRSRTSVSRAKPSKANARCSASPRRKPARRC